MIVVDTSAWIDYFNGKKATHTDLLDKELEIERVIIGDLIITELLQGFKNEKDYEIVKKKIKSLEYRDFAGEEIAFQAVDNYRYLRKRGVTVRKTINVIIATFCIENGYELIHNDKDFKPFEEYLGLKIRR